MRDFHRERRLVWYILVLECLIIFYTLRALYQVPVVRFVPEVCACLVAVFLTHLMISRFSERCSNFVQGAITICCGMLAYLCYSVESRSDRLLPVCLLFVVAECTIYKNIQLNLFVLGMDVFLILISRILCNLQLVHNTYNQMEFSFVLLLLLIVSGLMMYMQKQDLFTERVAHEDEKSLDDLLQLVEMKCEEATAAAEAKSSFLANMSHEIRTPINAVLGMNEMILREAQETEIRGYAQNIQSAGTALLSLINDILDISKIESGKMELMPEKYQLGGLLYDIILVVQPRMEKKGLQLILDLDENIPNELYGDEVRIRQIITNILTNAVKYTEKGSVTLRVQMKKKDARHIVLLVSVKDTGIGIKESKEVLFASFQRGRDLRAHHIEGTGLGLSITRQLLEMMGSDLEMESVYGKGSTFSFDLVQTVVSEEPMGNLNDLYQKRLSQEQKYRESFTAKDAHVLVVDDNGMNLKVVASLLKQTLVQIDTAQDGAGCLEKCARNHYDLILMDHLMPNMDGVEAFHRLRADKQGINYRTPVIILTANAVAGMKQQYLDEGFNGFLSKPVQGPLLEETLRRYLPEELVTLSEQEQTDDEQDLERRQALQQVVDELQLPDMDLDDALQYSSGTVTDVLENIRGYLTDSVSNRERIEKEYEAENWNDFKIHVHALKSTSRIVGAVHMAYLAEQMEKAAGSEDLSYIMKNYDDLICEHEQLCVSLEHLLDHPAVQTMIVTEVETEQTPEDYLTEAEQFVHGVEEYDVDFERLREFCSFYPTGMLLEKEREELSQAVENFDYEAISQGLAQIIDLVKKGR
ncbi:MAG: response regulator [Lachnospiraceae bacterium]|nr:response regulator [Lachnospiraceae bacterium]